MTSRLEPEIDRLYQLPLDEFTAARNALARTAGPQAADVRQLGKPPVAAWGVNQLYWKRRDVYDALIDASTTLRKTHKTILGGRRADLREPARAHEAAIDEALKATLGILQDAGHPATDATRQAVLNTLRALPTSEAPGRLSKALQPGGFEMLQGFSIAGSKGAIRAKVQPTNIESGRRAAGNTSRQKPELKPDPKVEALKAEAMHAVRDAEQAVRREEFEAMRASRTAERSAKQLERAREALKNAQEALDAAEAAATEADRQREAAVQRAKATEERLEAARRRHDALLKS
jgi:hypothetical protein